MTPLPLTREWSGFYKLRVGDYRVIYEFDRESRIIIIRVGHRSEVYDYSVSDSQEVHSRS
ncbi:type II toxin-antitoxin system RelE family toxin [Microcystis aeruginosa]|uniref:type II toxin-antitoxin system RelE family toxin n=1 Tax=Microcystis aeruginosa TaxID=1126 RepID=UPI00209BE592|nr:type II toxin-antitoxin system RelE/ParE family toxin [Microcystis aeruginosa]MDB9433414.1 type II toxin-antitoxin system RelE/ParE family toxin [Microcystis aeruginosa CS-552/01]